MPPSSSESGHRYTFGAPSKGWPEFKKKPEPCPIDGAVDCQENDHLFAPREQVEPQHDRCREKGPQS